MVNVWHIAIRLNIQHLDFQTVHVSMLISVHWYYWCGKNGIYTSSNSKKILAGYGIPRVTRKTKTGHAKKWQYFKIIVNYVKNSSKAASQLTDSITLYPQVENSWEIQHSANLKTWRDVITDQTAKQWSIEDVVNSHIHTYKHTNAHVQGWFSMGNPRTMHVVGPNLIDHIKLQVAVLSLPPIGERSTVMTVSVCVCLSASISLEILVQSLPNFLCMLCMATAWYVMYFQFYRWRHTWA